jgi:phage pi2 protein 07
MTKLGIVIPLKSSVVSRDWIQICKLLNRTLDSIINQTLNNWSVVVVGHEKPLDVPLIDSGNVLFHPIELDAPHANLDIKKNVINKQIYDYILDKTQKIVRGFQILKNQDITHWFVLDADDLLHRDFIKKTISRPNCEYKAVILNHGWIYYPNVSRIIPCHYLANICGSTTIIPSKLVKVPDYPSFEFGDDWKGIPWCVHSHGDMFDYLCKKIGIENVYIPKEKLISYVMSYGDNCSDEFRQGRLKEIKSKLKPWVFGKKVGREYNDNFLQNGFY